MTIRRLKAGVAGGGAPLGGPALRSTSSSGPRTAPARPGPPAHPAVALGAAVLAAALLLALLPVAAAGPAGPSGAGQSTEAEETADPAGPAEPVDPIDRVPVELMERTVELRHALENVSGAGSAKAARTAHARAKAPAAYALSHLPSLAGADGELVVELWRTLGPEVEAGNLTNARSLAGSAVQTLRGDVEPRVEAWDARRTAVTVGLPSAASGGGVRLPLVLLNPPPGGLAAFDVEVRLPPDGARALGGGAQAGQGQERVDAANGSVRVASFDARALAGLATAQEVVVLGHALYEPVQPIEPVGTVTGGPLPVAVKVHDLVDPQGTSVPVVSPDGSVDLAAARAGTAALLPPGGVALGLVAVLGAGALLVIRRIRV